MKVQDILARIDSVAPFCLAEDWDNVGLMIGDLEREVRRVGLALDPLPEVIEEAFHRGCQALISHHPLFFKPISRLDLSTDIGKVVHMAIRSDMAVIAAHTNWDCAEGGVNRVLAERLKLADVVPLVQSKNGAGGLGAIGDLRFAVAPTEALDMIKKTWNLTRIEYYGPMERVIRRISLCGGSGGSIWPKALEMESDMYITGDMKYHEILTCVRAGLPVALADHAEMENLSLPELARWLAVPGELEVTLVDYIALKTPLRM